MSIRENITRSIRISDAHWYQLEVEARRLGYRTRHKFIAAQLLKLVSAQTTPETDKAIVTDNKSVTIAL